MAYVGKDGKDDSKRLSLDRNHCNMEYINRSCSEELEFFLKRHDLLDGSPSRKCTPTPA